MKNTNQIKKPSQFHNNRSLKNWLIYNINDKSLIKHTSKYKGTLYDLGCGNAPFKDFFLQYADHYIGVDWEQSCHNTQENIVADLNKTLPINSNVADTVVSLSVLEHLYNPQTMINEAFRILKPGGNIALQVPWQWQIHEAPHDYYRFSPFALKHIFEQAGFTNIKVENQSGFMSMWVLKFNYFTARFIKGPKPLKLLLTACLLPFWSLGQVIAPLFDKLDRQSSLETTGYFVTGEK